MHKVMLWIIIPLKGSCLKSEASGSLRHMAHSSPELHNIEITRSCNPVWALKNLCHSEPKYDQGAVTGWMHSPCLQHCRLWAPTAHQKHLAPEQNGQAQDDNLPCTSHYISQQLHLHSCLPWTWELESE